MEYWVLFGSHEGGPDRIRVGRFDSQRGDVTSLRDEVECRNPAFYIFSSDARFLYVCNQADGFVPGVSGGVTALAFDDRTGKLKPINAVSSHGLDPSHLAFDRSRQHLFIANYSSGTIAVRALSPDGGLGAQTAWRQLLGHSVHPQRQTHSYAHCSVLDPSGRYLLVADLGADKIWIFGYDATTGELNGEPSFGSTAPGDGARHLLFHPNGRWLYVDGEMGNNIIRFDWNGDLANLTLRSSVSTLPRDYSEPSTTAELLISSEGDRLYVTNRGHDSIATLDIEPSTGDPSIVDFVPTEGQMPRNLEFTPDRKWAIVTNHASNSFRIFACDKTGRLQPHGDPIALENPYCPRFVPIRT